MKAVLLIVLVTGLMFVPTNVRAQAQTLRCSNGVITTGDTKATTLKKCGEPTTKDSFCKIPDPPNRVFAQVGAVLDNITPCETVEEWTYDFGSNRLPNTLEFRENSLRRITSGDRAI